MSMLKNARNKTTLSLHADGCSCCNTKARRRKAKKAAKGREERAWRGDIRESDHRLVK